MAMRVTYLDLCTVRLCDERCLHGEEITFADASAKCISQRGHMHAILGQLRQPQRFTLTFAARRLKAILHVLLERDMELQLEHTARCVFLHG
jgi:siderophore synthetase component